MRIYTRKGDDGTTGLFHGGRVGKDAPGPEAYGTVDEAVAVLRSAEEDVGEIFFVYVVDDDYRLVGVLNLGALLLFVTNLAAIITKYAII